MEEVKYEPLVEKLKAAFKELDEQGSAPDYWFADGFNTGLNWAISCIMSAGAVGLLSSVPLTLEQLREMDGEPVWGVFPEGNDRYMIIQWHNSEFFKTFECGFLLTEGYGKSWLAYRRRPEEGTT